MTSNSQLHDLGCHCPECEDEESPKKLSIAKILLIILMAVAIPCVFAVNVYFGIVVVVFVLSLFGVNVA